MDRNARQATVSFRIRELFLQLSQECNTWLCLKSSSHYSVTHNLDTPRGRGYDVTLSLTIWSSFRFGGRYLKSIHLQFRLRFKECLTDLCPLHLSSGSLRYFLRNIELPSITVRQGNTFLGILNLAAFFPTNSCSSFSLTCCPCLTTTAA